jgi:hypothetical protein
MLAPPTFNDFLKILLSVDNKNNIQILPEFINVRPSPFSLFKPKYYDSSSLNAYCTVEDIKKIYLEKLADKNIIFEYSQNLVGDDTFKDGYIYVYTVQNEHLDYLYILPVEIIKKYYKENILNSQDDRIISRSEILEIDT